MIGSQNKYRFGTHIGSGGSSNVYLVYSVENNEPCICKMINKEYLESPEDFQHIQNEVTVLRKLNHPHIVKYVDYIETPTDVQIYMELCKGQPLLDYLNEREGLSEYQAWIIFQQLVSVATYLHSNNVAHRDLKPDNITIDDSSNIKVIDFGLCSLRETNTILHTFCGSILYLPPECIKNQPYIGSKLDVWALGVILFALRAGYLPWKNTNVHAAVKEIVYDPIEYPSEFSPEFIEVLKYILVKEPNQRPTAQEISHLPWVVYGPSYKQFIAPLFSSLPSLLAPNQKGKTSHSFIINPDLNHKTSYPRAKFSFGNHQFSPPHLNLSPPHLNLSSTCLNSSSADLNSSSTDLNSSTTDLNSSTTNIPLSTLNQNAAVYQKRIIIKPLSVVPVQNNKYQRKKCFSVQLKPTPESPSAYGSPITRMNRPKSLFFDK